jgi:transcriptional regulator with XRE-family HTH domain
MMSFNDIAARMRKHTDQKALKEETPRDFDELYLLRARILGVLIRDARQAAGLDPDVCASQVGVAPETLEQWEFGRAMPSLPQLELLAYTFDVPISHFWGAETLAQQMQRRQIDQDEYVALRNRLIGGLLRAARQQRNLTPEQLADDAGISPGNVTAYELGQRPIPAPVLMTLASVCQVNLSYFLENGNRIGEFLVLQEDLKNFTDMPDEMRQFVASPINQPYLELAMKLAKMGTDDLRGVAEAILNITL